MVSGKLNYYITLITDFGIRDYFAGVMKGVIYNLNPEAKIIDITHDVPPGDIRGGAFHLFASYRFFPPGTVHLLVVDPGVGTGRRAIAGRSEKYIFVAPDNGLLTPVMEELEEVVQCNREEFFLKPLSHTFHGRDIFAPVAAHLSRGKALSTLGKRIPKDNLMRIEWNKPQYGEEYIKGEVLHVDRFGNLVTNLKGEEVLRWAGEKDIELTVRGKKVSKWASSYQEGGKEVFLITGSLGLVEISVKGGNASQILGVKRGDEIRVTEGKK